jgi:hypothetical protein
MGKRRMLTGALPFLLAILLVSCAGRNGDPSGLKVADKPLFRDPIHDGAADPAVIWNSQQGKFFMYYTNRRADVTGEQGVCWVHGTRIGIAVSADGGASWVYLDTCDIGYRPDPDPTYWAPEVLEHEGTFHMYLTYVPGVFPDWKHPRYIVHLTSQDGIRWEFVSKLDLSSEKVLDACVYPLPGGGWRLWYNNEADGKTMYFADSKDLYDWKDMGKVPGITRGEGANVFYWKGSYWMLVDEWKGLGVYRSPDLEHWSRQEGNLLSEPGTGPDDGVIGQHCDVLTGGDRAYIFYFTHPGRIPGTTDRVQLQRSSIQVAELAMQGDSLICHRNLPVHIRLSGTDR